MKPSPFILQRKTVNLCISNSWKWMQAAKAPPPYPPKKSKPQVKQGSAAFVLSCNQNCSDCTECESSVQLAAVACRQEEASGWSKTSWSALSTRWLQCFPLDIYRPAFFFPNERVWTRHYWPHHMGERQDEWRWTLAKQQIWPNAGKHDMTRARHCGRPLQVDISLSGWKNAYVTCVTLCTQSDCENRPGNKLVANARWLLFFSYFTFFLCHWLILNIWGRRQLCTSALFAR